MSGSYDPVISQSTPKATKKLQESLPVIIQPETRRGRGGRSRRRFEAVHLTSPEVVKERRHLLEENARKEIEKKELLSFYRMFRKSKGEALTVERLYSLGR